MYTFTMLKLRSGKDMEIPKSFLGYKREKMEEQEQETM